MSLYHSSHRRIHTVNMEKENYLMKLSSNWRACLMSCLVQLSWACPKAMRALTQRPQLPSLGQAARSAALTSAAGEREARYPSTMLPAELHAELARKCFLREPVAGSASSASRLCARSLVVTNLWCALVRTQRPHRGLVPHSCSRQRRRSRAQTPASVQSSGSVTLTSSAMA